MYHAEYCLLQMRIKCIFYDAYITTKTLKGGLILSNFTLRLHNVKIKGQNNLCKRQRRPIGL
jgi:hypothetical protein